MGDDDSDVDGPEEIEEIEVDEWPDEVVSEDISSDQNSDLVESDDVPEQGQNIEEIEQPPIDGNSLLTSRESALIEEKRWKGIDEKFLSNGLRLLHILPVLSILLIALTRTFRGQSPLWCS